MTERHEEGWTALADEITATFSPCAPIQEREAFAGRSEHLDLLFRAVQQRGRHAIVFGERGVGKTSLANVARTLLHRPNRELVAVRVNANASDTFDSLFRKVFKRLTHAGSGGARRRIEDDYRGIMLTPDDVQLELEQFATEQNTVIVLDEFDRLQDDETKNAVAELLKALSDFSINATLIIVGIAESVANLILEHNSNIRSLLHVQMPRMSQEELGEIIQKRYTLCGMSATQDSLWKMTFLARGLPYYAQLIGMHAALSAVGRPSNEVDDTDVHTALESAISEIDMTIREHYVRAIISQKGKNTLYEPVLLGCALAATDELGRFQQSAVSEPLSRIKGKRYSATTYAFHMNEFCSEERGRILEKIGEPRNFRYRFSQAMMQPFVVLKGLQTGVIDDATAEIHANQRQLQLLPE